MSAPEPWYKCVDGPFPAYGGPVGVKDDGGGSTRARGLVGHMNLHRAAMNRDATLLQKYVDDDGEDVNEVEAAGNTPLHFAAYAGWMEGAELLLQLGAKVNATNNAGDAPWHWAMNMGHEDVADFLVKNGANKQQGLVLVPDHVPKVKDFYERECWSHHPKPHEEFIEYRKVVDAAFEEEKNKLVPGM